MRLRYGKFTQRKSADMFHRGRPRWYVGGAGWRAVRATKRVRWYCLVKVGRYLVISSSITVGWSGTKSFMSVFETCGHLSVDAQVVLHRQ
jgi:hypothetical protein